MRLVSAKTSIHPHHKEAANTEALSSDIHPWDILINGERWAGKVRLIGFVDAFFLICYSGTSRFEHGLMIYSTSLSLRPPFLLRLPHITPDTDTNH